MAETQLLRRKEIRVPLKMFVNLTTSDNPSFEIAPTVDISCHGTRVVTARNWQLNEQLPIRPIRGSLKSLGRVPQLLLSVRSDTRTSSRTSARIARIWRCC
jgi:hypothetical protein